MMNKLETIGIGLIFGAVPVVAGALAGWWLSVFFMPEPLIPAGMLAGLMAGILIDVAFLKKWIHQAYSLPAMVWIGIYLFYSAGLLGMFMGVPLFNVGLAVPAGCFIGAYLSHQKTQMAQVRWAARRSSVVTTCIMALVCATSAAIALSDPYTAGSLEGMLGLGFSVTLPMIIALVLVGGSLLLVTQWWLTEKSVELAYRYFARQAERLSAA
jgi:hypothetical protein